MYIQFDLNDLYSELTDEEKKEIISFLIDDGLITKSDLNETKASFLEKHFVDVCIKLSNAYHRLDTDDQDTIIKIFKKYY